MTASVSSRSSGLGSAGIGSFSKGESFHQHSSLFVAISGMFRVGKHPQTFLFFLKTIKHSRHTNPAPFTVRWWGGSMAACLKAPSLV